MKTEEKVRENRYRRWAKRLGLFLKKSKGKLWSINNQGGYMIIDIESNIILCGEKFDLSLDNVGDWLEEYEQKISSR